MGNASFNDLANISNFKPMLCTKAFFASGHMLVILLTPMTWVIAEVCNVNAGASTFERPSAPCCSTIRPTG